MPNECVMPLVEKTVAHLGVDLPNGSIVSAARLYHSNKPNTVVPIQITFSDKNIKELVFSKKKNMGTLLSTSIDHSLLINGRPTSVSLRNELTPLSLELLRKMREYQKELQIQYVWPGQFGGILVKKSDNCKPDVIKTREDLSRVIEKYTLFEKDTVSPNQGRNNQIQMHFK